MGDLIKSIRIAGLDILNLFAYVLQNLRVVPLPVLSLLAQYGTEVVRSTQNL
jgi:hypothetical protein